MIWFITESTESPFADGIEWIILSYAFISFAWSTNNDMFTVEPIDSPRLVAIRFSFAALITSVHTLILTMRRTTLFSAWNGTFLRSENREKIVSKHWDAYAIFSHRITFIHHIIGVFSTRRELDWNAFSCICKRVWFQAFNRIGRWMEVLLREVRKGSTNQSNCRFHRV